MKIDIEDFVLLLSSIDNDTFGDNVAYVSGYTQGLNESLKMFDEDMPTCLKAWSKRIEELSPKNARAVGYAKAISDMSELKEKSEK